MRLNTDDVIQNQERQLNAAKRSILRMLGNILKHIFLSHVKYGWKTFQPWTFQPHASTPHFSTPDFLTMNFSTLNFSAMHFSNQRVQKFMFEKSRVENSGVEKLMVVKFGVEISSYHHCACIAVVLSIGSEIEIYCVRF